MSAMKFKVVINYYIHYCKTLDYAMFLVADAVERGKKATIEKVESDEENQH